MNALLLEIQNGILVTPVPGYSAEQVADGTALAAWYTKCGAVCNSGVADHAVILMYGNGSIMKKEVFNKTEPSSAE